MLKNDLAEVYGLVIAAFSYIYDCEGVRITCIPGAACVASQSEREGGVGDVDAKVRKILSILMLIVI